MRRRTCVRQMKALARFEQVLGLAIKGLDELGRFVAIAQQQGRAIDEKLQQLHVADRGGK